MYMALIINTLTSQIFEHALQHTQGEDLAKILWLKSDTSEVIDYHHTSMSFDLNSSY